jgi:hypothetical protein
MSSAALHVIETTFSRKFKSYRPDQYLHPTLSQFAYVKTANDKAFWASGKPGSAPPPACRATMAAADEADIALAFREDDQISGRTTLFKFVSGQ